MKLYLPEVKYPKKSIGMLFDEVESSRIVCNSAWKAREEKNKNNFFVILAEFSSQKKLFCGETLKKIGVVATGSILTSPPLRLG